MSIIATKARSLLRQFCFKLDLKIINWHFLIFYQEMEEEMAQEDLKGSSSYFHIVPCRL